MSLRMFESSSEPDVNPPLAKEASPFKDYGDDFIDEAFADEANHSPEEDGASETAEKAIDQDEESISSDDVNQIAGNYNASEDLLISKEYQLKQDEETPSARTNEQKGSIRAVTVVGGIGGAIAAGALLWFGFLAPKPPPEEAKAPEPSPTPTASVPDQTAELKSRLAFAEQQRQVDESRKPAATPRPTPKSNQPNSTNRTSTTTSPPARTTPIAPTTTSTPPQRITPAPPRPIATAPAPVSQTRSTPPTQTQQPQKRSVDPFERWRQLSELGQEGESNRTENRSSQTASATSANSAISATDTALDVRGSTEPKTPTDQQSAAIETATIGSPPTPENVVPTPGEIGILNSQQIIGSAPVLTESDSSRLAASAPQATLDSIQRKSSKDEPISSSDLAMFTAADSFARTTATPVDTSTVETTIDPVAAIPTEIAASPKFNQTQNAAAVAQTVQQKSRQTQEVTLGTSVQGRVKVPLIWGTDGRTQTSERGAIELTQPLLAGDGSIALPAGTTLITQTTATDGIPRTDVIAVIRNQNGTVQQYPLPRNILVVRSANGGPLEGRNINQINSSLLRGDDLLVGAIGGLGRIGEVLNQPETQSNSSFGSGGFSQSTVTQSRDPNIVGAILQGALEPAAQRIERRLKDREQAQQQQNLPNVTVLERGATVTIVAQNILKVNP
ncbi:hypothetical protein ACQ4M3_20545 [Leptolyngbya sp. AN03gr2]|uniref:hypothetical protein n=1 Tax=unclassified Leptolyngbya TaxID=2650499 RepID=UPI003D31A68F